MTKHLNNKSGPSRSPSKGKESPNTTGKTLDLRDCPLSFPEFASVDNSSVLPRYHAVLKRSESEGISLEDVDALQMELEALLSSTVVRKVTLKEEHKSLTNWENNHKGSHRNGNGNGARSAGKRGPSSPGKKAPEDRYGKKHRLSGKPFESSSSPSTFGKVIGMPKIAKSEPKLAPNFDPLQNEQIRPVSEPSLSPSPKNETPGRFWSFVEPYCAPITNNEVTLLQDLLRSQEDLSEYLVIPKKGKHYSRKWADEEGGPVKEIPNSNPHHHTNGNELGDLTQRLVSGLMEDANGAPSQQTMITKGPSSVKVEEEESSNATPAAGNHEPLKYETNGDSNSFSAQAESLEAHVFKELEEQGIFAAQDEEGDDEQGDEMEEGPANNNNNNNNNINSHDIPRGGENDEILEELKRCQKELRALSNLNLAQLTRLLKVAKEEVHRQELRNKLNEADRRVMEAYKKISLSRSLKKEPPKKDRELAWKALKERETILKQLESV
eukprot:TRINITY_DN3466_c0_g9_i1.p1 TRINITY_DN3466_c0_g9~~TRINITY_DN3466_c0_g9_i1.p1  ORF type:complete len:513 (-),score=210.20 TRINITY_DN3466_c0_g9_i1:297-1784(-)